MPKRLYPRAAQPTSMRLSEEGKRLRLEIKEMLGLGSLDDVSEVCYRIVHAWIRAGYITPEMVREWLGKAEG